MAEPRSLRIGGRGSRLPSNLGGTLTAATLWGGLPDLHLPGTSSLGALAGEVEHVSRARMVRSAPTLGGVEHAHHHGHVQRGLQPDEAGESNGQVHPEPVGRAEGRAGQRRNAALRGRPVGTFAGPLRAGARLALVETLRNAAPWQAVRRRETAAGPPIRPTPHSCARRSGSCTLPPARCTCSICAAQP
jgi:hypothetical protein